MGNDSAAESAAVENIMGQYLFAAGAGANGQWIRREAVALLRNHYLPSVRKAVGMQADWGKDAVWILHYVNVIGRFAAQKATDDGRDSISAADMKQAIASVEANYRDQATTADNPTGDGVWCNP
jgi:hypothetical protein